jgi:hypothetical protein
VLDRRIAITTAATGLRPSIFSAVWCTTKYIETMSRRSNIDFEACWKALGGEMFRECNRMNHHFRCRAGEARFTWLTNHTMVASTNEFRRVVINKGVPKPGETTIACFTTNFYADENSPPEEYVLTIDEHMACGLSETEERVSVREMCRRLFDVLCASSSAPKIVQPAS